MKRVQLLLLIILTFVLQLPAPAQADENKRVRVGWYESTFNHIDRFGRRSGYAYEYQLRIAANSGWQYEYVEGSWPELLEMLKRGEIDLLSDITDLPERHSQMLFSAQEMGTEDFFLLWLYHGDFVQGDPELLKEKRIGVNHGSYIKRLVEQWLKQNNVQAEIVELYATEEEHLQMLKQGIIDVLAANTSIGTIGQNECVPLVHLGSANYFFGINKARPDLKEDIDKAMVQIHTHNAYYNRELHEKYYSRSHFYRYLPKEEMEWVKEHKIIRIGYRDNYLPFCGHDEKSGEVSGMLHDFIDQVNDKFHNVEADIVAIPYPTINDAIEALHKGEVDVAFPVGLSIYDAERSGLLITDPVVRSAEMAVVRSDRNFNAYGTVRAAINAENPNYLSLINEQYPDWDLVHFPTTKKCLEGVAADKADLLLVSNYRLSVLDETIERLKLKAVATGSVIPLSFATSSNNHRLFSITARLSHMMSDSEIHASLSHYSAVQKQTSFSDFFWAHTGVIILILVVIITLFIVLFLRTQKEHHRAEAASAAKSRFLFSMSHDIRTPMNAIMGYITLMKMHLNEPEKQLDYLEKVHSASEFLLNLINNVLEMARIENGKLEIKESPQQLGAVLCGLKALFEDIVKQKHITLTYANDVHNKAIYCDNIKLNEIYLNLLSNAYKYTPDGGSITVFTKELDNPREGWTTIQTTVTDTGIGMSAEYLPHLFEDFTREQTFTDSKIQGSGLGLSITKHLVELMGGTITVESELGKGTTFTVTLSHRIADERLLNQQELIAVPNAEIFKGRHVLMAEDNDLNAEIAIEILSSMGLQVDHAENGAQCVEMLKQAPAGTYDAILMDIQMPVMNGYEATVAIRSMEETAKRDIPIIAMTANAFEEDKRNAYKVGMNGHLSKPVEIAKLMEALNSVFNK